ncbi:hypothetical protein D3C87_130450 [compost metagenome]
MEFELTDEQIAFHRKMQKNYIHDLLSYCKDNDSLSVNNRLPAKDAFLLTEKELKRLNHIIRNKKISNDHIGNSIFNSLRGEVSDNEFETHIKDHFTAGYMTFLDIKERLIKDEVFDQFGIRKFGYIISLIIYDIAGFADFIGRKKEQNYYFFLGGKSNIEHSKWHYLGTFQLLHHSTFEDKRLDDKFAYILSAVSLRQTLELKTQRILGVGDYFDKNGKKVFASHNFFFNFVDINKDHFNYGKVNFRIIQKIFEFCNISVHKGIMPYFWQMHFAIKFCDPLFYEKDIDITKGWHIDGAIKIKKYEELKNKLRIALQEEVSKKVLDKGYIVELEIHWIRPEAEILKD